MKTPTITIRIDGEAGSGKSTLAQHLGHYLKHGAEMDVRIFESEEGQRGRRNVEVDIGRPPSLPNPRKIVIIVGENS